MIPYRGAETGWKGGCGPILKLFREGLTHPVNAQYSQYFYSITQSNFCYLKIKFTFRFVYISLEEQRHPSGGDHTPRGHGLVDNMTPFGLN